MQITIQCTEEVAREVARALKGGAPSSSAKPVLEAAKDLKLTLRPMHPGVDDAALIRYFVANAPGSNAEPALARLRQTPGITAAYAKPPDALP